MHNNSERNKIDLSQNPFIVDSPEKLDSDQIVKLFVEEYSRIESLKQYKHTILWGSRGSGKSMLFRYMEPVCQCISKSTTLQDYFFEQGAFLGIYCPIKEGWINQDNFELLNGHAKYILSEHILNIYILGRTIHFLQSIKQNDNQTNQELSFVNKVIDLFDLPSILPSVKNASKTIQIESDPYRWIEIIINSENRKIFNYLRENATKGGNVIYQGATSGYHDFLLPFIIELQSLDIFHKAPVFLLIDDAHKLDEYQQTIINSWIANRDQEHVCIKVSSDIDGYKTFKTRDGGFIEQPHDYSEVFTDELYSRKKSDYYKKIELIANKRLLLSDIPTKNIIDFLPVDSVQEKLYIDIRQKTEKEWEENGKPQSKDDYLTRYTIPRLFQHLAKTRRRRNYAGFDNLVDISSGIVRNFLEPTYLMVDELISKDKGIKVSNIKRISPGLQDKIIRRYSEDYLMSEFKKIKKIEKDHPEICNKLDSLRILIESLGRIFYKILINPNAKEARVFSFTVRGQIPSDLSEILELGVKYRYFHERTYGTKEGGGREPWFILNRRLCPMYKLDPSGFEGRLSLTPDDLRLATEDTDKFLSIRLNVNEHKEESIKQEYAKQETLFFFEGSDK